MGGGTRGYKEKEEEGAPAFLVRHGCGEWEKALASGRTLQASFPCASTPLPTPLTSFSGPEMELFVIVLLLAHGKY